MPSEAVVVIKFKNLQDVSSKIATLSQQWGLANIPPRAQRPARHDPDRRRPRAGAEPQRGGRDRDDDARRRADEPDIVALVPVSDFKAFAAALPNAKTEGEVTTFNPGGKDVFAVNWGQYAAVSPKKELIAQKGGGLKATTVAARSWTATSSSSTPTSSGPATTSCR